MPETSSDVLSLNEMLAKITKDLREQMIVSRIDMVEAGYAEIGEEYFEALKERAEKHPDAPVLKPTPAVERAIRTAAAWHAGQSRKDPARKIPYVAHVLSVAEILARHGACEAAVIAGLLHDTVEDTAYTLSELASDFGDEIAEIVHAVSEEQHPERPRGETWLERKTGYLNKLTDAPDSAVAVSCADKIHNLASMREAYRLSGDKIWEHFNSPADKKLWFYEQVLRIACLRLEGGLVEELAVELERMKALLPR